PSGMAVISVDSAGENSIIVIPGANSTLRTLTPGDTGIIARSRVLVAQLEIPLAAVGSGFRKAHEAGVTTILNPSPVQPLPDRLLSAVSLLVVNEGESAAMGAAALGAVPQVVTTLGAGGAHYRGPDGVE